jgi:hypothetical protein
LIIDFGFMEVGMTEGSCEYCTYYAFDEDEEDYVCDLDLDEDDYVSLVTGNYKSCPYFRDGNEYKVVRHQM